MAGRDIIVLAKEGCPNTISSDIAVIAAFNKGFPFGGKECLRWQTTILRHLA
jgi:hypothetical protein